VSYTLNDIKLMVMDIVGEDSASPTYWNSSNDSELTEWINDAFEQVCLQTGQYVEEFILPLFANRAWYRIDPGKGGQFLWIKYLRLYPEGYELGGADPNKLAREDYNWMTRTGTPRAFFPLGINSIRLVPYPSTNGQSLEGSCVCLPPSFSLNDTVIDLDKSLIRPVLDYAAGMALISMRRLDKALEFFRSYSIGLGLDTRKTATLTYKSTKLRELGQ